MSLSRYSELAIVATLLAAVLTAGVAGAVDVTDETVPEDAAVGEEITVEAELTDLYADSGQWQFAATTGLENAEWTTELYRDGERIDTSQDSGDQSSAIELDESASDAPDTVVVNVTGEVPDVESFSYEDGQQVQALELLGHNGERFTIETFTVEQYTTGDGDAAGSRDARTALDDARSLIDEASDDGHDVSDAESRFEDAVASYDDGNFDDAVAAAEDAVEQIDESTDDAQNATAADDGADDANGEADGADTESDDGDDAAAASASDEDGGSGFVTLLLYGLGFLALVAVVGGVLYVRGQQQSPNRDPLGK